MNQNKIILPLNSKKDLGFMRKHEKFILQQLIQQYKIEDDYEGTLIKKKFQELQYQVFHNQNEITEIENPKQNNNEIVQPGTETNQKERLFQLQQELLERQKYLKEEYLKYKELRQHLDQNLKSKLKQIVRQSQIDFQKTSETSVEKFTIDCGDIEGQVTIEDYLNKLYSQFAVQTARKQINIQQEIQNYQIQLDIKIQQVEELKKKLQSLRECKEMIKGIDIQ